VSYPVLCGAVVLTSANNQILINEGASSNVLTIPAGTYYLRGSYTTNYCPYSEDLSLWSLANVHCNPQFNSSPTGNTATLLTAYSAGGFLDRQLYNFGTGNRGVSFFIKKGTASSQSFRIIDYTLSTNQGINVSWTSNDVPSVSFVAGTGTVLPAAYVGNGWWRIKVIFNNLIGANVNRATFYPAGTSGVGTCQAWGFQVEDGAPTTALAVKDYVATPSGIVASGPSDDLAFALRNAMQSAGASANTYELSMTLSIDPALSHSIFTVTRLGADIFGYDTTTALTTFDERLIGLVSPMTDGVPNLPSASTISCAANWVGNDVAREIEPYSDRIVSVPRAASGRVQGVSRSSRMQSWRLGLSFVDERRMLIDRALSAPSDTLEGFIERFGAGASFELHEVQDVAGTTLGPIGLDTRVGVMHFSEDTLTGFRPQRIGPGVPLYSADLTMHAKV
jgi:hypothetical protein